MRRVVVSAPFGNYVRPAGVTPTLGTFTVSARPGRLWRVLRTVRYSRRMGAWVNRIGLRNPGIGWLARRVDAGRADVSGCLVSVHGFEESEWGRLIRDTAALRPLAVELNVSCPNIGEVSWPEWLFREAVRACGEAGVGVVVKIPPVRFERMVSEALSGGVRAFHCCNTLPVPGGGLSGRPLRPLSLRAVGDVRRMALESGVGGGVVVIGGGGVTGAEDVDAFAEAGADRVAVGSALMSLRNIRCAWDSGFEPGLLRRVRERAEGVLGRGGSGG
jgi:dihydroorotate dehydrogenase